MLSSALGQVQPGCSQVSFDFVVMPEPLHPRCQCSPSTIATSPRIVVPDPVAMLAEEALRLADVPAPTSRIAVVARSTFLNQSPPLSSRSKERTRTRSPRFADDALVHDEGRGYRGRAGLPSQRRPLFQIGIPARLDGWSIVSQYRHAHLRVGAGKFWGMIAVPGPSA